MHFKNHEIFKQQTHNHIPKWKQGKYGTPKKNMLTHCEIQMKS